MSDDLLDDILACDPTDLLNRAYHEIRGLRDLADDFDVTVHLEPPDQDTTSQATITVRLSTGSTVSAKALGPRPWLWDTRARVSWSSIGPQSPDDALAYAAAIRKAAEVAVTLSGPTGVPS